jgi:hypothetical protein
LPAQDFPAATSGAELTPPTHKRQAYVSAAVPGRQPPLSTARDRPPSATSRPSSLKAQPSASGGYEPPRTSGSFTAAAPVAVAAAAVAADTEADGDDRESSVSHLVPRGARGGEVTRWLQSIGMGQYAEVGARRVTAA